MPTRKFSYEYPHPAVTTDIVVFTVREAQLQLLLIKRKLAPFKGSWALPGGFVRLDEDIEQCASRELLEETGVTNVYLEQLYTFGHPRRDPRERVITVAYFALIPSEKLQLKAATDAAAVAWFPIGSLPKLAFDHATIVAMARSRLVKKLEYSTIAFQFLSAEFTLTDAQKVHETILETPLDKRNFRKWALSLQCLEETGEERRSGQHRPAKLYRLIDPDQVKVLK